MEISPWLTSDVVEELQQAASSGQNIGNVISRLQRATLPGLLEYGCARWYLPSLPSLPPAIQDSPLGLSLREVRSELGLRADGEQKQSSRAITAKSSEFYVLNVNDSATLADDWTEFLLRFRQAIKSVGFGSEKATGISAALGEMADNATLHSIAPVGVLVGYQVVDGAAVCSVADVGIGALKSLKSNPQFGHIRSHVDAIRLALTSGVSRFGRGKGGLGFYRVFKALTALSGTLRFRSGEGSITMDGTEFEYDKGIQNFVIFRPGFQITICCRTSEKRDQIPLA